MKSLLAILFSILFFLPQAKAQRILYSREYEASIFLKPLPPINLPLTFEEKQKIFASKIYKIPILRGCPEPIKKPRAVNWRNKIRNKLQLIEFFGSPNYLYLQ